MTIEELRVRIEVEESGTFWGAPYKIIPRLIDAVFGDGQRLIWIWPIAARPNRFAVRVDSAEEWNVFDVLDEIADAAGDQFGYYDDEELTSEEKIWPIVDWTIGCSWSERFVLDEQAPGRELCPDCGGEGCFDESEPNAIGDITPSSRLVDCQKCGGMGTIPIPVATTDEEG